MEKKNDHFERLKESSRLFRQGRLRIKTKIKYDKGKTQFVVIQKITKK